jgi:hypothetical protein
MKPVSMNDMAIAVNRILVRSRQNAMAR